MEAITLIYGVRRGSDHFALWAKRIGPCEGRQREAPLAGSRRLVMLGAQAA